MARSLQRSLLPNQLVETVGVSVAARYLPASDEVGGDWYDVFDLPHGRLGIVIGDVVGHGVKAAALIGRLRTALRAYATEDHGPARTLELVDRFAQAMPDYAMATAMYAVFDPDSGALRLASAGNLPPIIVGGGTARVLDVGPAPPLGTFPYGRCQEHEASLAAGETLMFYTDGLVERPKVPLTKSVNELLEIVRNAASAEELCQRALVRLSPVEGRCATMSRSSRCITATSRQSCVCACRRNPGFSRTFGGPFVAGYEAVALAIRSSPRSRSR